MQSLKDHTDGQLIVLLREDSEAAFTEIYHRYFQSLFRHASKMMFNDEGAADVVHDVFANVWVKRRELRDTSAAALKYYLFVSVRNAVLNDRRNDGKWERYVADFIASTSSASTSADERLLTGEMLEAVEAEISALPEGMRTVFQMRRDDGLSLDEIADRLDISKQTVKNQLNKSVQRLWKKFSTYFFLFIINILYVF